MAVSFYCRVIFYADKSDARGKNRLLYYGPGPTSTRRLCGIARTPRFSGLRVKSIHVKTLCNFLDVLNEHFRTQPKVMCSSLPYCCGSTGRQLLTTNRPFSSHHTLSQTRAPLLFCLLLFLSLCISLSSAFPPLYPTPSSLPLSMRLRSRFLASFPSHPLLKSETARNPTRFSFGQPRGNGSEREAQVRLQLLIKKLHCPAQRDVRNDSGFNLSESLYVTCADPYEDILYIYTLAAELEKWKVTSTPQNTHPWRYSVWEMTRKLKTEQIHVQATASSTHSPHRNNTILQTMDYVLLYCTFPNAFYSYWCNNTF